MRVLPKPIFHKKWVFIEVKLRILLLSLPISYLFGTNYLLFNLWDDFKPMRVVLEPIFNPMRVLCNPIFNRTKGPSNKEPCYEKSAKYFIFLEQHSLSSAPRRTSKANIQPHECTSKDHLQQNMSTSKDKLTFHAQESDRIWHFWNQIVSLQPLGWLPMPMRVLWKPMFNWIWVLKTV